MSLQKRLNLIESPVFLIDGSAYLYRGFFAKQNLHRSDGFATGALVYLARFLLRLLREESPQYLLFVLDGEGKNFRHNIYPLYKANRDVTPENLIAQIIPAKRMIRALGLKIEVADGCEADDCIASLAARFSQDRPVVIVGGDKDLKQCLGPSVYMWDPVGADEKLVTEQGFIEENGVMPAQWADMQALLGDASDNIPGVPGIGPVTAKEIFMTCRNLEEIRNNILKLPSKIQDKLKGHIDEAFVWRRLTTLVRNVCAGIRLADIRVNPFNLAELQNITDEFELTRLRRDIEGLLKQQQAHGAEHGAEASSMDVPQRIEQKKSPQRQASLLTLLSTVPSPSPNKSITSGNAVVFDRIDFPTDMSKLQGTDGITPSLGSGPDAQRVCAVEDLPSCTGSSVVLVVDMTTEGRGELTIGIEQGRKQDEPKKIIADSFTGQILIDSYMWAGEIMSLLPWLVEADQIICADFKSLLRYGLCGAETQISQRVTALISKIFDLGLADWLTEPDEGGNSWPRAARAGEKSCLEGNSAVNLAFGLAGILRRQLAKNDLEKLYAEMELPLIPVLTAMEERGIAVDLAAFQNFLQDVKKEIESLTTQIYSLAGIQFNLRSSRQLGEILFERMGLPVSRRTQNGQGSTSQEILEKFAGQHEIVDLILRYRKFEKMRSTYLEPLPRLIDATGRLHTTFNQKGTATGRLSSSNPNLQNIPVRGELGKRMRACFVASLGHVLISADYSQIELRVLAHMSQDVTLLEAFRNDEDIHARTAALIYDIEPEQVSTEERRSAKTVNFGLIYGMGAQKLARELNIRVSEAKVFIERYFSRLTGLKSFYDNVEEEAKKCGFVVTLSGRRRFLPDIYSANAQTFALARRQAINTVIQGSAADIIKLAMLAVDKDQELKKFGARLILQIHDELVIEVPAENAKSAAARTVELMRHITLGDKDFFVPLAVDCGYGINWGEAH